MTKISMTGKSPAFTDNFQMELQAAIFNQLAVEDILNVDDLIDFDTDSLEQVANNLCCPADRAVAFTFGAKLHKNLLAAAKLVKHYKTVGRALTAPNISWNHMIWNFEV